MKPKKKRKPITLWGFIIQMPYRKKLDHETFRTMKEAEKMKRLCELEGEKCGTIDSFTLPAP